MARGPKKHLKRLCAPKNWLLDKLGGVFAPRPSPGPHKARECLPLILIVRNRLKYALTGTECTKILMARAIKIDSKVRTDKKYPVGFMDVISIEKTNDFFRLLYDVKGRFVLHRITKDEASYKILAVRNRAIGPKQIPYITTHDGRTIRYPDPSIRKHDSVRLDLKKGKIIDYIKFEPGSLAMVTAGSNVGRVGVIVSREKHMGSIDIVNLRDSLGHTFATRITSCCVIGKTTQPYISLPKGKGIKLTPAEERDKRLAAKRQAAA